MGDEGTTTALGDRMCTILLPLPLLPRNGGAAAKGVTRRSKEEEEA